MEGRSALPAPRRGKGAALCSALGRYLGETRRWERTGDGELSAVSSGRRFLQAVVRAGSPGRTWD